MCTHKLVTVFFFFFFSSHPPKDERATGQIALSQHLVTTQGLSALNCAPPHVCLRPLVRMASSEAASHIDVARRRVKAAFLARPGKVVYVDVNGSAFNLLLDNSITSLFRGDLFPASLIKENEGKTFSDIQVM